MAKLYIGNTAYKVMLGDNSGHIKNLPTIIWNQLVSDGHYTFNSETTVTPNSYTHTYLSVNPIEIQNNHVYFLWKKFTPSNDNLESAHDLRTANYDTIIFRGVNTTNQLVKYTNTDATGVRFLVRVFNTGTEPIEGFTSTGWLCVCDVTLMFGAGNEPTTVEEFERWFIDNIGSLDNYYPYNEGKEIEVKYLPKYM